MVCKKCGKEFTEKYSKYSNGDFCSKKCAKQFAAETNKGIKKEAHCKKCNKIIIVGICSKNNNVYCKECYKNKRHKKCKICGQYQCLRKDICRKKQVFPTLIKHFGFDKNTLGTIDVYKEFQRIINIIENEYFIQKLSLTDIKDKYKFKDVGTLGCMIKNTLNIKLRNLSEANKLSWKQGKINIIQPPQYKHGWYIAWNGKKVYYRSSYELDYCKELDEKKVNYEMETKRFWYWDSQQQKQRVAIPDFYLPETNEIVEIKSNYTYNEINMKDKFKAYKDHGYKTKLILEHKEVKI